MDLSKVLKEAIEVAKTRPKRDRDTVAHAIIVGSFLKALQLKRVKYPSLPLTECRELLLAYSKKHGNPHLDKSLAPLQLKNLEIAALFAAFREDGGLSARYKSSTVDAPTPRDESFYDLFYRKAVGGLGVEICLVGSRLRALLADENIVFSDGMLYPMAEFYRAKDRYEVKEQFEIELEKESDPNLKRKLKSQIAFLDGLPSRTIEDLCQAGLPLTSPLLPPEAIAQFPGIQKLGDLRRRSDGIYEMYNPYTTALNVLDRELVYLLNYLNNRPLAEDPTSGKKGVSSRKGREFILEIEAAFNQWLPASVYRQTIEDRFNRFFNSDIPLEESCEPFYIEKLSPPPGMSPLPHQWQDCRFLLQSKAGGGAFLSVGLGKTLLAIMTVLAGKQIGRWQKPCIVVPKSLIASWYAEILRWTKDVKLLAIGVSLSYWDKDKRYPAREIPGTKVKRDRKTGLPVLDKNGNYALKAAKKAVSSISGAIVSGAGEMQISPADFDAQARLTFKEDSAGARAAKLERLATEDFDIVLTIPESGFKDIPLSPQREYEYTLEMAHRGLFGEDISAKYFAKESIRDRVTRLQRKIETLGYQELDLLHRRHTAILENRGKKTQQIYFDSLGIDCLVFDEAHRGRNSTKPNAYQGVRGLTLNPSQRAYDMQLKAAQVRAEGGAVFALTATPICNNIADLYSLMRLFADEELCEIGIDTLDDFLTVFADIRSVDGFDLKGDLQSKETLVGLKLVPELKRLVGKYCTVRDRDTLAHLYPETRSFDQLVPMTPIQSYLYKAGLERMEKGIALQQSRDVEALKESPELHPFSVFADLGKLTLSPQLYQSTTLYGDPVPDSHWALQAIAKDLGAASAELNAPIESYFQAIQELAYDLALAESRVSGVSVFGESGEFSSEFKELEASLLITARKQIGELPDYLKKEFGLSWQQSSQVDLMGAVYQLNYRDRFFEERKPGESPLAWRWEYVKGELKGEAIFSAPKIEKTAELCELYYHAGSIELQQPDGSTVLSTPYHLFDSAEETERRWREIAPGQQYLAGKVLSVGRGNVVIFCDFVGSDENNAPTLFTEIARAIGRRGIPQQEIGFVCGGKVKKDSDEERQALSRQSVADWFNAGFLFAAIGSSGVMGEGLNLQGSVYPAVAAIHLTLPWNQSTLDQRNGRVGRQGNRSNWIDLHYLLSPQSSDLPRIDLIRRKKGVSDSFAKAVEEDGLKIESVAPTLDELSEMLSSNPVAIRKRRASEAIRLEAVRRQRLQQVSRKRLSRYFYQLLAYLKAKAERRPNIATLRDALEVDRQFLLSTLDAESGTVLGEIPDDGELGFLVTPSGEIYKNGDWVRASSGELFRIREILVAKNGNLEVQAIFADPDCTFRLGDLYSFSLHEFAWTQESRDRWKEGLRVKGTREETFFPIHPRQSSAALRHPGNTRKVKAFFFEAAQSALEDRLQSVDDYNQILACFSDLEMQNCRVQICKRLSLADGSALFWSSDGRLEAAFAGDRAPESMAVPSDLNFKEEYCLHLARHLGDGVERRDVNHGFLGMADLLLWPLGVDSWGGAKDKALLIGREYGLKIGFPFVTAEEAVATVKRLLEKNDKVPISALSEEIGRGRGVPARGLRHWIRQLGFEVKFLYCGEELSRSTYCIVRSQGPVTIEM